MTQTQQQTDTTYNGWANYETWAINLWLTNDEYTYGLVTEVMPEAAIHDAEDDQAISEFDINVRQRSISNLADTLNEMVEQHNPIRDDASLWSDLLTHALGQVNWREIAEGYIDEYQDNA